ncbi:MAG: FliI/YscN family ATPase [Rubrimonas sp.]|uniref:FliI/YscN family ATPase n=1 Tax=Rubrimonas sp. TaxID=2036015 RepID=UPI003DCBCCE7
MRSIVLKSLDALASELDRLTPLKLWGRVSAVGAASLRVGGLEAAARRGDRLRVAPQGRPELLAEIVSLSPEGATAMWFGTGEGVAVGDRAWLEPQAGVRPGPAWIGRVVDAFGAPLDGRPLADGPAFAPLRRAPPPAAQRRALGARLETGLAVFDTLLPIARGQRIGLFAGSGVGKSTLLAQLARGVQADVVVLGLIGERGREVRDFIENVLGPEGMKRAVVVAATADQSPLAKRQAAWLATAVAETFRDEGRHVLLLLDSITRFAEAHREVALAAGEAPSLRAYPPSTAHAIASLVERAGPGAGAQGDVTAVYSVLVAGSDMEEPVADITRGAIDGHVVLERTIAERGRYPAVDVRRSVSRSLPGCASQAENALIARARRLISVYEDSEPMIRTGLYAAGADPEVDAAIAAHGPLEALIAAPALQGAAGAFATLAAALGNQTPRSQ